MRRGEGKEGPPRLLACWCLLVLLSMIRFGAERTERQKACTHETRAAATHARNAPHALKQVGGLCMQEGGHRQQPGLFPRILSLRVSPHMTIESKPCCQLTGTQRTSDESRPFLAYGFEAVARWSGEGNCRNRLTPRAGYSCLARFPVRDGALEMALLLDAGNGGR